jgi:hypothetical protein
MLVPHHTSTRPRMAAAHARAHFPAATWAPPSFRPYGARGMRSTCVGGLNCPQPPLCRAPGRASSARWQQQAAPSPGRPRPPPAPARPRTSRRPGPRRGQRAQGRGKGPPRRRARRPARPSPHPGALRPWAGARARARAARRRRRGRRRAPPRRTSGRRRTGRARGAACARGCAHPRSAGSAAGRARAGVHGGGRALQHARSSAALAVCWASATVRPNHGALGVRYGQTQPWRHQSIQCHDCCCDICDKG